MDSGSVHFEYLTPQCPRPPVRPPHHSAHLKRFPQISRGHQARQLLRDEGQVNLVQERVLGDPVFRGLLADGQGACGGITGQAGH